MIDVSSHPLMLACYNLCLAIERCGASPELTDAVTQAGDLLRDLQQLVAPEEQLTLERYLREALERGAIDHSLRAHQWPDGRIAFYLHPSGRDGMTVDFQAAGNLLAPLS